MTETEIKLRWDRSPREAQGLLERHGYVLSAMRALEADQLFDLPSGGLRQSDRILRLRRTTSPEGAAQDTVTYKGPATREVYKSREEIEFEVSDGGAFALVLERLGYRPGFRYEKYRTKFTAPGEPGIITIDETPIGVYLELEGPQDWIESTSGRLGFSSERFLTSSYAGLYRTYREGHPDASPDMTFDLRNTYTSRSK